MSIRKSLVFSYLDRYASLTLAIISSMLVARLLTPEDIGVFSVTMVMLAFLAAIRDMGVGGYLVQERELTVDRVRAVWAVQLSLGLFLGLVVLLASAPVAYFYGEPRMQVILYVMAANYALNPFGSLTYAWQIREMKFDSLAFIRFTSTIAGSVVSVYLAWKGWGPLALALGALASTLAGALLGAYFRPRWFPWLPGTKELKRVLSFGTQSTGAVLFQTLGGNAAELILGKTQGMVATGLLSRASGLVAMFDRLVLQAISSVATPWFAKQSREHGRISEPFIKATAYVTAVGWAFALGLLFLAYPAIRIMYGSQWDGAVQLTQFLSGALALSMPASMCSAALMASGAVTLVFRAMVVTTLMTLVLSTIGAAVDLPTLGACLVIASALKTWYWLKVSRKALQFEWAELIRCQVQSASVGLIAAIGPCIAWLSFEARPENVVYQLLIGVPAAMVGFVGAIFWLKHPLHVELSTLQGTITRKLSRN